MSNSILTTDLSPHIALITGATGGIGKATCLALAALGCSIAVHYNSTADTAVSLADNLKAKGVRAEAFQADLSSYEGAWKLHVDVVAAMGNPSVLFNNAGLTLGKRWGQVHPGY
jgi:3-oxoacyl-[acyl-carrier protein] reductase